MLPRKVFIWSCDSLTFGAGVCASTQTLSVRAVAGSLKQIAVTFFVLAIVPGLLGRAQQEPSAATSADHARAALASKEESQAANLQKAVQNPVASLISVPVQNNANFAFGPYQRTQDVLELEPVIPIKLNDKWNLLTRTILPIVWQPYPREYTGGEYGLGDLNPTFFLSPVKPGKLIWGAGPAMVIPTATSDFTGQGKLSLGPSLVLLTQPKHWTLGVLNNNVWSVAGSGSRPDVNQMVLQYFIAYNLKKGYFVHTAPIVTSNWEGSSGDMWTVPFGAGVGRVMKLGAQPVNLQSDFYRNAVYPTGTSTWTWRWQVSFLFPKLSPKQKMELMEMQLKKLEQEQNAAKRK